MHWQTVVKIRGERVGGKQMMSVSVLCRAACRVGFCGSCCCLPDYELLASDQAASLHWVAASSFRAKGSDSLAWLSVAAEFEFFLR
jgi:hypothetical protein